MKTFEYRGFDFDGHTRKGLIEALDTKDARERLAKTGVLAHRIMAAGRPASFRGLVRRDSFTPELRATVYRELGALLRAGLPMVKALDILIKSPEMGELRNLLAGVRDNISEGTSLAQALSGASESVGSFEEALIEVGERSGSLGDVIERLARFIEEQQSLKERIKTALIYPAVVVLFAVLVAVGVFVFVLPRTNRFLVEMGIPMPGITRFMIGIGNVTMVWSVPVIIGMVLAVLWVRARSARDPAFRWKLDRRFFTLPVVGRGYTIASNLRFARTLSVLLFGGVPLIESLVLAGRATGSAWIEHLVDSAAESVRHGSSLADAVRRVPPLSASLPSWIQAGEASGETESLLAKVSDRYQQHWDRFVARTLELIEPIIILMIGVFVLLVTLAILLPITAANQMLQ